MTVRKAPRPTSVAKAIDLLSASKTTIQKHGRPRRRPNLDNSRPVAVSRTGKIVSPYSPGAERWNLVGAFKADAKALGYTKSIIDLAEHEFVKAYMEAWPYGHDTAYSIDQAEWDTREIVRALQRAIRNLQAGVQ